MKIFGMITAVILLSLVSACKALPPNTELSFVPDQQPMLDQVDSEGNPFDPDIDPIKNQLGSNQPVYTEFKQASYENFLGKAPMILFFHAPWCPLCRASDKVLTEVLPELEGGVIWFQVDYDTMLDLKKKYGITYQDTFVIINAKGEVVAKTNALSTAEEGQEWMNQALGL